MAKVSLRNVTKVDPGKNGRDVIAVNDLDLEIQDREFVVLAGPPNCGISSVVRMIAGLDHPAKGDIFIGDRRVNDLPPKGREIALVSRNYAPYPGMPVRDNLAFGLKLRKFPSAEVKKRVLSVAEIVGLQELLERKPESLTAEQCQRVAIARAIALQPKAFLFDEPLANLEPKVRAQMRHEIAKLHQRLQTTMIYATHDPIEAMAIGGRIVVVKDGAIQQDGTALSLYDEPANVFVAEFLSPQLNLLQGVLKEDRDSLVFTEHGDGTIKVRLPISSFPGARDFAGKLVLLGIRPGDIEQADVTKVPEKRSGSFPALVDFVEPNGSGANLYLQTGGHTLVSHSRRSMHNQEAGHRLRFELNIAKVCLFDPVSRSRIT
jgi:multiple sugar transport system ATP-binding protein